jgi:hypothetical protein
VKNAASGAIRY